MERHRRQRRQIIEARLQGGAETARRRRAPRGEIRREAARGEVVAPRRRVPAHRAQAEHSEARLE
ncbi:MAG: hypothetical protein LBE67_05645 [Kocuria palustris]|nr:hypothetical protein [Kocuria palustris]